MQLKPLSLAIITALASTSVQAENAQLDAVIISANNTLQQLNNITADATIISGEEIRENQYRSLDEVLNSQAGFSTVRSGNLGNATSIFMRGQNAKRILVLVDGVEMNDPMSVGGPHIENLPLNNIERIEIIRGPQSGVWGSGAMAGVINIITRPGGDQAEVSLEAGSYGKQELNAVVGAGNKQIDFSVDFRNIQNDGYSSVKPYKGSDNGLEKDSYEQTDIGFKMRIRPIEGHQVQFLTRNSQAMSHYDYATDPNADASSSFSSQIRSLQYQGDIAKWQPQLSIQETDTSTTYSQGSLQKLSARLGYQLSETSNLIAFTEKRDMSSESNSSMDYDSKAYGLTLNSQLLEKRWILELSARNDLYDRFDDKATGKIGSKFLLTTDWYLAANYGTAYRAPSLAEQVYTYVGSLDSESTKGYDLSIGNQNFSATYFHTKYDNEIDWDSSLGSFGSYANLAGESIYKGIELSYHNSVESLNLDYAFNFTKQTAEDGDGQQLERRPEQTANLILDYYGLNQARIGVELRYTGTEYDERDKQGLQIGRYVLADINADYRINKNLSLYAKVINLFDKDYISAVASPRDGGTNPDYVYGNGGRQYSVGIRGQL